MQAFREALGTNDGYAESALGEAYDLGRGVKRDYKQAFDWFMKGAEMGYSEAQFYVGEYYRQGKAVKRDYAEAVSWFERSDAQDDIRGLRALGKAYAKGEGVPVDHDRAMALYLKSAAGGDQEAMYLLGEVYAKGGDKEKARHWYTRAAEYTIQEFPYGRPYDPKPFADKAAKALRNL